MNKDALKLLTNTGDEPTNSWHEAAVVAWNMLLDSISFVRSSMIYLYTYFVMVQLILRAKEQLKVDSFSSSCECGMLFLVT